VQTKTTGVNQYKLTLKIMKKNGMNLLRAGVFVLAAVAAFAFTEKRDVTQSVYATDGLSWYDATGKQEGVHYRCDMPSESICLRTAPNLDAPQVEPGQFVNINLVPIP
jgi:hypothetical protein